MPTYTPLQSIELVSTSTSVVFSNIPQTYQDLVVVVQAGSTNTNKNLVGRLNGDTGSNYSITFLQGTGASALDAGATNETILTFSERGDLDNSLSNVNITHFMNYSNTTTYKTTLSRANNAGVASTSSPYGVSIVLNMWRNTSAINSIEIYVKGTGETFLAGSTFDLYGISPVAADTAQAFGGTEVYYDSTYVYHVFKGSGVFIPYRNLTADYLVIAGGGGGGASSSVNNAGGAGGGAGGYRSSTNGSFTSGTTYTVTVGAGGSGKTVASAGCGTNGSNSSISGSGFSTFSSTGGGGGGSEGVNGGNGTGVGLRGGSAGGNGRSATTPLGNLGGYTPSEGSNGGAENSGGSGGGGGGATSAGGTQTGTSPNFTSGVGGTGSNAHSSWASVTSTGVNGYYAGGGSGGTFVRDSVAAGAGGAGGGGTGGHTSIGTPGVMNTGSGGGGAASGANLSDLKDGQSGGSGLVIIRYAR